MFALQRTLSLKIMLRLGHTDALLDKIPLTCPTLTANFYQLKTS